MADDQKTKTMDINDLVRELSKSSTTPSAPTPTPAPQTQAPRPSFPTLPIQPKQGLDSESRTLDSSPKSSIDLGRIGAKPPMTPTQPPAPRPQFNSPTPIPSQPKPMTPTVSIPAPTTPPLAPGVKEYQSSIRTMSEDIAKIKQGQQPMGTPFPRKVEQVAPAPTVPAPVKPAPGPQFKVPTLGETQKAAPMTPSKDILGAPLVPKEEPKPQIYVPQEGQRSGNRNILFIGIGAVAVVAGFACWFFVLRLPAPEVVIETPTPTATPIPSMESVFNGIESQTVCTGGCSVDDFISNISGGTINGGQFRKIYLNENNTSGNMSQVLTDLNVPYPTQLKDLLGSDSFFLTYGQKEVFDSNGQVKIEALVEKRLIFVSEVTDATIVSQLATVWETEMANNLKTIFQFDPKKQMSSSFGDNSYKGVNIRFKNFPFADRSIDYTVVSALNGKSYFVIGNSRESVYSIIDKLKGF